MPLDPIVSLSVAETPSSCAVLVGSGVYGEAGVPTGMDVYWLAVADLYKVETKSPDAPDRERLAEGSAVVLQMYV